MFEPNEQRRKDFAALLAYAAKLEDGQRRSWLEVETVTGVKMNDRGKDLLRAAMSRAKRPYLALPGLGFEVSAPSNALEIVQSKTRRFVGALDVARETTSQIATRHLDALPSEQKSKLLQHQAVFDTLSLNASLTKRLPAK